MRGFSISDPLPLVCFDRFPLVVTIFLHQMIILNHVEIVGSISRGLYNLGETDARHLLKSDVVGGGTSNVSLA